MSTQPEAHSWFGPSLLDAGIEPAESTREFSRLWRGFMTARVTLGLVLLLSQGAIYALGHSQNTSLLVVCSGYFAATLAVRLLSRPRQLGRTFDPQWLSTIGVDVMTFAALQFAQGGSGINYTPLFALPVLLASVLGSLPLALGTAASVTLLLLASASWLTLRVPGDATPHFMQSALTGVGCFVIAFLANQLSVRLASEEQRARRSRLAARVQRQVNELVIESLPDGILVVDMRATVRAANPAARHLLGSGHSIQTTSFALDTESGWQELAELASRSFAQSDVQQADVSIHHAGQGPRRVRVRTRLTATQGSSGENLCVMFLQDQREVEARMRTEKLASMGRMSAAVAHEIRNPLAAIAQANALLGEDLTDPRHQQLTLMVQQNAKRLEKIVEEILDISRVQRRDQTAPLQTLALNEAVERICQDWSQQTRSQHVLRLDLSPAQLDVAFEPEHLRRVLVNLLDNARRYASEQMEAIQVSTRVLASRQGVLGVWSNGPPLEQSVERHLFEPFFSSESRSSGLGLYICRELCEGHGASIVYQRTRRTMQGRSVEGNEFLVSFRLPRPAAGIGASNGKMIAAPWHRTHP